MRAAHLKRDDMSRFRGRIRTIGVVALGALTFGLAAPVAASAVGITIPGPINANVLVTVANPPSITITPNPLPPIPTTDSLLGITNIAGGTTQTTAALTQLLNAVTSTVDALGPTVNGLVATDLNAQLASLQAHATAMAAAAAAADTAATQAELMDAVAEIQAQALSLGLTTALTTGLTIAQDVLSPVCSLTAVPTSFIPGLGLDLTRTYKLAAPTVQQTDAQTDALIKQTYNTVYAQVIALLTSNPTTAAVPALLTLLKFDWTTVYEQPDGTRITKVFPGLINIPTPLDVDNSGTFDVCATAGYAIDSATSAITMKQTITKMPLAKAKLPLKISSPLLAGVLALGYDTTSQGARYDTDPSATVDNSGSTAPVVYTTAVSYGTKVTFDNTYAVHRGTTLTLPPVIFNTPPVLPTVPPLTEPAPTPKVTQQFCLVNCSTLAFIGRYEDQPNATHLDTVASPSVSNENLNYTGAAPGGRLDFSYALLGGLLGVTTKATPSPSALGFCASATVGTCSTAPHKATDKGSLNFASSQATHFDNSASSSSTTCAGRAADVHVDGTRLNTSNTPPDSSNTNGSGKAWTDTGGQTLSGCVGYASSVTGIPAATFTSGHKSSTRDASYHVLAGQAIPDSKSGSITCPAGTTFTLGSSTNLTPALCPFLPAVVSGPTISTVVAGETVVDSPLTANSTWSPAADSVTTANSPTTSYAWSRCNALGASCTPVAGATDRTFTPQYGDGPGGTTTDIGRTFRVTVTGTNFDGSVTSPASPQSDVVAAPSAAPGIINVPTITGVAGTGRVLTANNAVTDWSHGVTARHYQWQRCTPSGALPCTNVGTDSTTYTVAYPADLDSTIKVTVTATNHVGSTPATSATVRIQPAPVAIAADPPKIQIQNATGTGGSDFPAGSNPFTGQKLFGTTGGWQADTALAFAFQWMRCEDAAGTTCAAITDATTNKYTVNKTLDLGKFLQLKVTATNNNLDPVNPVKTTALSAVTPAVTKAKPAVQPSVAVDGTVNTLAFSGHDTTYVGGTFDTVGPAVGGAGNLVLSGATAGTAAAGAQVTGGVVKSIVSDLLGGYFIGGDFTKVQGVPCASFAHIASTGVLDASYCAVGIVGDVHVVSVATGSYGGLLDGTFAQAFRVVVGGLFTAGGHQNLVYIDPTTKALSFDTAGDPNGAVNAVANGAATLNASFAVSQSGRIYIGGDFTKLGSTTANHVARDNWGGTAAAPTITYDSTFTPSVCTGAPVAGLCPTASVKALGLTAGSATTTVPALLVGGSFDGAFKAVDAPTPRANAAAFSVAAPGTVLGWNPNPNGVVNALGTGVAPTASVPGPIFLGGSFTHVGAVSPGGLDVQNFAEFGITGPGGASATAGTQMNGAPSTAWVPTFDGPVTSISGTATASGVIAVGGSFTTAQGQTRHRLALYANQASAGTAVATLSTVTGHAGNNVLALARDSAGRLLAGGSFKVLGGAVRKNAAEVGTTTGVSAWVANTDGPVTAIAANTANVYLAGGFTKVNGTTRSKLAAVLQSDGSLTAWSPSFTGSGVNALAATDTAVYAGGDFTTIGGAARSSLAALDPATGSATSWNSGGVTGSGHTVSTIVVIGNLVYVGGSFTGTGGQSRANAAAIDSLGAANGWNPAPDGAVKAIAINADDLTAVFIGGRFDHVGGSVRTNLAKVDVATGVLSTWVANTGGGGGGGSVNGLTFYSGNLIAAGDFATLGGIATGGLGAVDPSTAEIIDWTPQPSGAIKAIGLTSGGLLGIGGDFVTFSVGSSTSATPVFSYRPGLAFLG
jgi:hypothetical protein